MTFSEQISSFVLKLFSIEGFPPRWYCGEWSAFHGWTYIISNVIIWLAYYLIPATFLYIVIRRSDLPFRSLIIWFVAFIAFCGATHLMEAIIFWYPLYRLNGLLLMGTAFVSVVTVWKFYKGVPEIMTLRTNKELEIANAQLRKSEALLRQQNKKIRKKSEEIEKQRQELLTSQRQLQEAYEETQVMNEELRQTQEELKTQRDYVEAKNKDLERSNHKFASSQQILVKMNQNIQKKNQELESFTQKINNSIKSAKTIQEALLPTQEKLSRTLKEYFLIYRPKDVVSGDFYWLTVEGNRAYLAVADCTGHGVPGAFMANMGITFLYSIIRQKKLEDPAEILKMLHREVSVSLKQSKTGNNNGMDIALLSIEKLKNGDNKITFCGAKRPLYYFETNQNELKELKETRKSIGGIQNKERMFETQEIILPNNSLIYLGSDGLEDQNDRKRKKFSVKRIKRILEENAELPLNQQQTIIEKNLNTHMKGTLQRDDILWMGIKI